MLAASVVLPVTASAHQYNSWGYRGRSDTGQSSYRWSEARPRGDWSANREVAGYPEFRSIESHIREEIRLGVDEGVIEDDDADDLSDKLRDIQRDEAREFAVHGWELPYDDRLEIRNALDRLDSEVDDALDD